jgi:hypothetical protein
MYHAVPLVVLKPTLVGFLSSSKVPVVGGFLASVSSINTSGINMSEHGSGASFHTRRGEK